MNPQVAGNTTAPGQPVVPPPSNMSGDVNPVKTEAAEDSQMTDINNQDDWDDERRLVSALCTLQQMHGKINQLRSLLPGRLLGPLKPVITQPPGCDKYQKSPQELCQELSQSARSGMSEIESFKNSWNSPEMTEILDRVDARLKDRNGEYPHMSNMWERDYEEVLASLDREEKHMEEVKEMEQDKLEKEKLESAVGGWKGIVEAFKARNISGISLHLMSSDDTERFSVDLQSISTTFYVQRSHGVIGRDSEMWHVSTGFQQNQSKLVSEILDCIQARQRQWDIQYLLEMISSYIDIKRSPCVTCKKMINTNAQLPTVRKPKTIAVPNDGSRTTWEPFHPQCVQSISTQHHAV